MATYDTESAAAVVYQVYENVVQRAPDAAGLAGFTAALVQGATLNWLEAKFAYSAETQQKLVSAYYSIFGYSPTSTAIANWEGMLAAGQTFSQVRQSWYAQASSEISQLYIEVAGRTADANGLTSFTNALLNGMSLNSIRHLFSFSKELTNDLTLYYASSTGQALDPASLALVQGELASGDTLKQVEAPWTASLEASVVGTFASILNRTPTSTEMTAAISAILGGSTISILRTQIADSDEAVSLIKAKYVQLSQDAPTDNQVSAFQQQLSAGASLYQLEEGWASISITSLYQELLGRAPDPGGLASFSSALLTGTSLETLRTQFADSDTVKAILSTAYENVYNQPLSDGQLASTQAQLAGESTLGEVEAAWLPKAEAIVSQLYQDVLGRYADPNGLASYSTALLAGTTIAAEREQFAYSQGAQMALATAYENAETVQISPYELTKAEGQLASGLSLTQVEKPWFPSLAGATTPPLVWMAAVDPYIDSLKGGQTTQDYMSLFSGDGNWTKAVNVFKISTQFAAQGSAADLRKIFLFLNEHHVALALEGLMLPTMPGSLVGRGVEGYTAPGEMKTVAARILSLGGDLKYIAMDEPLYFGHQFVGANAANSSISDVATAVARSVLAVENVFPNVQVGDIEPLPRTNDIQQWAAAYETAVGKPLAFLDADVPWSVGPWQGGLEQNASISRSLGIPFGVIYNGDIAATASTDPAWVSTAEARIAAIETDPLIRPEQAVIQTWSANPTYVLPEADPGSLSNLLENFQASSAFFRAGDLGNEPTGLLSIALPSEASAVVGVPELMKGLSVSLNGSTTAQTSVGVICLTNSGDLSVAADSALQIQGSGTAVVNLFGSLSEVNLELSTLFYTAVSPGSDDLSLGLYSGTQAPAVSTMAISAISSLESSLQSQLSLEGASPVHSLRL